MGKLIGSLAVLLLIATQSVFACTGVAMAADGHIVVGGNEDWTRFDSHVWAEAATEDAYGAVYFGYQIRGEFGSPGHYWFEFQGVNDQGLYFDTFGAPPLADPNWSGKPSCPEHIEILLMQHCTTVKEAVSMLESYNLARYRSFNQMIFRSNMQFFIADRTGTAAVVGGGHVHWMKNGYLVITNFRPSDPSFGGWPCPRYDRANAMLANDASPTADRVAEILDATQFSCSYSYTSCTRYSVICDLTNGDGYLYFDGDFTQSVALDLLRLCQQGLEWTSIEDLFASER